MGPWFHKEPLLGQLLYPVYDEGPIRKGHSGPKKTLSSQSVSRWGGGGQSVSRVCASVGTNGAVGINTCLCYTLPAISIHNTHQEPARAAGTGLVN